MLLEGHEDGVSPDEWFISRVCEEFQCTPLDAVVQPVPLTVRILELRGFQRAHQALTEAKSEKDVRETATVKLVKRVRRLMNNRVIAEGRRRKGGR